MCSDNIVFIMLTEIQFFSVALMYSTIVGTGQIDSSLLQAFSSIGCGGETALPHF